MFQARIKHDGTGLELGTDFNRRKFHDFLKKNPGLRMKIEPVLPESANQRRWFEGALVPLVTFYQKGMDHTAPEDNRKVRDWLKEEFAGEMVVVAGKANRIAGSTKGRKALQGFIERVMDWAGENGYQIELLNPEEYKKWRDEIFPFEQGPDNYIDYLAQTGRLKSRT